MTYCVKLGQGHKGPAGINVRLVFGPTYYSRRSGADGTVVFDDLPRSLPTDQPIVYVNGIRCSSVDWRRQRDHSLLAYVRAYRTSTPKTIFNAAEILRRELLSQRRETRT